LFVECLCRVCIIVDNEHSQGPGDYQVMLIRWVADFLFLQTFVTELYNTVDMLNFVLMTMITFVRIIVL